jgi:dCMP deaminase
MTWDKRWMDMVDLVATWSKDKSTKIGAVIVDGRNVLLSVGWNGICRGVGDNLPERDERPAKYAFYEHAERNAIYNAAAKGIPLLGATLYTQWTPCADCGRAVIQSGIKLVIVKEEICNPRWKESEQVSIAMFAEAGVELIILNNYDYNVNG